MPVAEMFDVGAAVLDTGAVTRGSGSKNEDKERNIRKWFVDHDLIDGVILLPDIPREWRETAECPALSLVRRPKFYKIS